MTDWNDLFKNQDLVINEPNVKLVEYFETIKKIDFPQNIIDLGCGTGRHSVCFAEKGYKVHAVDSSVNALEILKQNIKPNYDIQISQLDLQDLSTIQEKFDFAVCINVLSHGKYNEIEKMFYEIERIIKNNGILFLIITPVEFYKYVAGPDTIEVEKNSFLHINAPDGDIIHHFFTEEEVRHLLRNYQDVSVKNIMEYSPWQKKEVEHFLVIAKK